MSAPELSFTISIGEVILTLVVIALLLLVIAISRTDQTLARAKAYPDLQLLLAKECPARFGFLQKLPRGGTIPEECYVCHQLVECLGFQRNPRG